MYFLCTIRKQHMLNHDHVKVHDVYMHEERVKTNYGSVATHGHSTS
jgi:hypothetical protein